MRIFSRWAFTAIIFAGSLTLTACGTRHPHTASPAEISVTNASSVLPNVTVHHTKLTGFSPIQVTVANRSVWLIGFRRQHLVIAKTRSRDDQWTAMTVPSLTWSRFNYPTGSIYFTPQMDFISSTNGWIAWRQPKNPQVSIVSTTNGGNTWTQTTFPISATVNNVAEITFVNRHDGWIVLESTGFSGQSEKWIYQTTDGGRHWRCIIDPTQRQFWIGTAQHLTFQTDQTGWWLLSNPNDSGTFLYRTTNGGRTWKRDSVPLLPGSTDSTDVAGPVFSSTHIARFLVTDNTLNSQVVTQYQTTTGGRSWIPRRLMRVSSRDTLNGLAMSTPSTSGVFINNQFYTSMDTETGWGTATDTNLPKFLKAFPNVQQLVVTSSSTSWVILKKEPHGDTPPITVLLVTHDGGRQWVPKNQ